MLRLLVSSVVVLALLSVGFLRADDKNITGNKAKHAAQKATITKVDKNKGTITVRMKNEQGKEVEKTFRLAEDIRYFDSTGKVAAIDLFRSGNDVLVVEEQGHLRELHQDLWKNAHEATVTSVDKKAGTITVRMRNKAGKEVEKTLKVAHDTRYFDSTGREASLDDFHAGNNVQVIEEGGHLKELQKEQGAKNIGTPNVPVRKTGGK